MNSRQLKDLLDEKYLKFNRADFIIDDPVGIPHRFTLKQDIEIAGFFAAILAWGNRRSIINSCNKLLQHMDNSPFEFIQHHSPKDLKSLEKFVHRTFNSTDLLFLIEVFKEIYSKYPSLEKLFAPEKGDKNVKTGLINFHDFCFSLSYAPARSKKHIATPAKKSACKRLNMYLRWMVRKDNHGVDFGIWENIKTSQLICPLDVHVQRVAIHLGLLNNEKNNWANAEELTKQLKQFDNADPVKYDFALFGMGIENFIQKKQVFL